MMVENRFPDDYVILDKYTIIDPKKNEIGVTKVVQAVHPDLLSRVQILEMHMGSKNLNQKSIVPITIETEVEALNASDAKVALDAVEKELNKRETDYSDSWISGWLNYSNSESSWGLSGLWNLMSSFLGNLSYYKTETLQATRQALIKKIYG